jgi:cation:H+ antiporter
MLPELLLFAVGLACIVKGGDLFVSSSVRVAELLRMPRVVIGSTLVSLATTTPEMAVSVLSGVRGESGLALGNAVGSCLCNLGLILGTMAAVREVVVHPRPLRFPFCVMMAACGVLFLLTRGLRLERWQGGMLAGLGVAYFVYDFWRHRRGTGFPEESEAAEVGTEWVSRHPWLRSGSGTACLFLLGAVLVVGGSWTLVGAAVRLALRLGVPSIVVGLTAVAVGTSLPELVTALASARRRVSDLALGNLLGANVANLTLIVGSAAAIHEVEMSRWTQRLSFPAMLVGAALAAVLGVSGGRLTRRKGWVLIGFYGLYLAAVGLLAAAGRA